MIRERLASLQLLSWLQTTRPVVGLVIINLWVAKFYDLLEIPSHFSQW